MVDLARLTAVLEAEISRWSSGLDKAEEQLERFSDKATDLLKDVAGAFGLYLSVDSIVEWGKALVEQDANLDHFSQETGIAVDALSRLEYALQAGGVQTDQLTSLFKSLQKSMTDAAGNATSNAAIAFKALGISLDAIKNSTPDQTIKLIANSFQGLQDGANKSTIAVELLGKSALSAIPTLNKGADGIAELEKQADKLGITVSGQTAKAAEDFETDLTNLGLVVKDGLGERIKADLLPVLDSLVKSFTDTATGAQHLDDTAAGIASFFKGAIVVGLEVVKVFEELGTLIGGVAAAATAPLNETVGIIKETFSDIAKEERDFSDKQAAALAGGTQAIDDYGDSWDDAGKKQAKNLAQLIEQQKAFDAAVKTLTTFDQAIRTQIASLQDSGGEAAKYTQKLQDLAKVIADAGPKGKELAAAIEADIATFKKLGDTKIVTDGLAKINIELDKLKGDTGDSAVEKLDKEFQPFITTLRKAADGGDELAKSELKRYDALVAATAATADYNKEIAETVKIQEQLQLTLAHLKTQFDEGAIGQSDYIKAVGQAQTQAADSLAKVGDDLKKVAVTPEQLAGIDRVKTSIEGLRDEAGKAGQDLAKAFGQDAVSALQKLENGTDSLSQALGDLLSSFANELLKLANQKLVDAVFGQLISSTGGGSGAGIFGTIAGAFAGGKASGGSVVAGNAYMINENTPDSEYFIPKTAGQVVPASKMGGGLTVHQYFSIQAPTGTVSRQTQAQVGAAASRNLAIASKRNN